MELRARKLVDEGRKTVLFEIMEERGRPRLTSGIWKRALDRDDDLAHELVDRAVRALGAGVASAVNVLDVEAVVIGGGLGLKLGEPYAERLARGHAAAPVRLRTTARDPRWRRWATSVARSAPRCSPAGSPEDRDSAGGPTPRRPPG